jgi:thiol:disulfide interchange protein DsbD
MSQRATTRIALGLALASASLGVVGGTASGAARHATAQSANGASRHTSVTLLPEVESIEPGRPFWMGVLLKMEPGWHTYWKNPGDSGLQTRIRWQLPQGFEAGEIQWPTPARFALEGIVNYGYDREVLLLTRLQPPASLGTGTTVRVAGRVDWLECKEACLPGKAELSVALPVRAGEARVDADNAALFAESRQRLPRNGGGLRLEASAASNRITLAVAGAGEPREAYFYAARPEVVDHAAPQELTRRQGGFGLGLARPVNAPLQARLEGVLVLDGSGYEIDTALRR